MLELDKLCFCLYSGFSYIFQTDETCAELAKALDPEILEAALDRLGRRWEGAQVVKVEAREAFLQRARDG